MGFIAGAPMKVARRIFFPRDSAVFHARAFEERMHATLPSSEIDVGTSFEMVNTREYTTTRGYCPTCSYICIYVYILQLLLTLEEK